MRTTIRVGALTAAGAMVLAGTAACGSGKNASTAAASSPTTATPTATTGGTAGTGGATAVERDYERVVKAVLPSIVQIKTDQGEGSGVVYDSAGDIVTNAHVVAGAKSFKVTPASGGQALTATLVGSFNADDLAVLKVSGANLRAATFGNSGALQVGQIVMAMGNPLGLNGSVTQGIVSALGRTVTSQAEGSFPGATISGSIQTSAAINPGNSGGALANLGGQVIGIPSSTAADPQQGTSAQGIGFAIPASTVQRIVPQLIQNGKVTDSGRAALGVTVRQVVDDSGQPSGEQIVAVTSGGGAEKAGLKVGDVITAVNGTATLTQASLAESLANLKVGQQVTVDYTRDGQKKTATVTLSELPSS